MTSIVAATLVATDLGFPEGPLVLSPDRIAFAELYRGRISVFENRRVRPLITIGGSPNGLALGPDGRIFGAQNGGDEKPYRSPRPQTPAIVAISDDGAVETITTTASGRPLRRPNDLCFDRDGILYFTDPGDFDVADNPDGGWICRHADGETTILHEVGSTYPNGIGVDRSGRLLWSETHTRRIVASDGAPVLVAQLDEHGAADGFAICPDDTILVATLHSGGVDVVPPGPDGERRAIRARWAEDVVATNCAIVGKTLWVTDASSRPDDFGAPTGRLWRLEMALDAS